MGTKHVQVPRHKYELPAGEGHTQAPTCNPRCKPMHRCVFVHRLPCTQAHPHAQLNTRAHKAGAHSEKCENTLDGFPVQALVFSHTEITGCADPFFRPHPRRRRAPLEREGWGSDRPQISLQVLRSLRSNTFYSFPSSPNIFARNLWRN